MGNGLKRPEPHAFLLSRVSYLHGEWPQKAITPCILAFQSFIFAWGMTAKGHNPMHSCFPEFHIYMGNGRKRPEPHAFLLPRVSYLHGE